LVYCFVILLFIVINQSCDINDLSINTDIYPTTYKKLDIITLNKLRTDFSKSNPYSTSSITDFGFCGFLDSLLPAPWPERIPDLNREIAVNTVKSFVSLNSKPIGVINLYDLTFERVDSFKVYDGSIAWDLLTGNEKYKGIEVLNTSILFIVINGKIITCRGNWFPFIYIPIPKVHEEMAKSILLNKVIYLSDLLGKPIPMTITAKSLETSEFTKMIYPLNVDDKIELHVIWQVNIPDVYYVIYLDVMTGNIIGGYPTVIS